MGMRKTWNSVRTVTWTQGQTGNPGSGDYPGNTVCDLEDATVIQTGFHVLWKVAWNEKTDKKRIQIWGNTPDCFSYLSTGLNRESRSCEVEILPRSPALFLGLGYNHRNRSIAGDVASDRRDKWMSCLRGTRLSLSLHAQETTPCVACRCAKPPAHALHHTHWLQPWLQQEASS